MFWRDPQFWADLTQLAPLIVILLAGLAGSFSSFTKPDKKFTLAMYLYELASALVAGYITFQLCTFAHANQEIAIAFTVIGSYFGNQMLPIFYQLSIAKLKKMLEVGGENKERRQE